MWRKKAVSEKISNVMMRKLVKAIRNPNLVAQWLLSKCRKLWSAKTYLSILFKLKIGKAINWQHPQGFNEKLNWLKVYHRRDLYTRLADKYAVKEYVKQLIGEEYVVPTYGCYDHFEDIDFNKLPNAFVLKATHDSSGAVVCTDKSTFNMEETRRKYNRLLKRNWYWHCCEWPYKNIKPRLLIDAYLNDDTGATLRDYKFMCFNGEPKVMYCTVKDKYIYENFYDMNFQPMAISHGYDRHQPEFEKPAAFEKMKELARTLSAGIPFVRVDFFYVQGKIYFGEYTFYDWGGMKPFVDKKWDKLLGDWLQLPDKDE